MRKYFKKRCSDFLFAQPSFTTGLARTLDIQGSLNRYNISTTGEEADLKGLVCDWIMIQADLQKSWAMVLDKNPQFLDDVAEAILKDRALRNALVHCLNSESNEKKHELEMAAQGA